MANDSGKSSVFSNVLKVIAAGTFVFIIYKMVQCVPGCEITTQHTFIIVFAIAGLILLPETSRLSGLKFSEKGFEASLSEIKSQALEDIDMLEDQQAAKEAKAKIARAGDIQQIYKAKDEALESNMEKILTRFEQGVEENRKLFIRYRPRQEEDVKTYMVAPYKIKAGETEKTKLSDYLWGYSYEHNRPISMLLRGVLSVEVSDETFDPSEVGSLD